MGHQARQPSPRRRRVREDRRLRHSASWTTRVPRSPRPVGIKSDQPVLAAERALGKPAGPAYQRHLDDLLYQLLAGSRRSAPAAPSRSSTTTSTRPRTTAGARHQSAARLRTTCSVSSPAARTARRHVRRPNGSPPVPGGGAQPLPAAAPRTAPEAPRSTAWGRSGARNNTAGAAPGLRDHVRLPVRRRQHRWTTDAASAALGLRAFVVQRSRTVSTVAALVVFLAALLVGMTWFSPDHSSAETPPTDPPRTTSPSPGAPSTLSTPPTGGEEPGNNADEGSGRQQHTQKGEERTQQGRQGLIPRHGTRRKPGNRRGPADRSSPAAGAVGWPRCGGPAPRGRTSARPGWAASPAPAATAQGSGSAPGRAPTPRRAPAPRGPRHSRLRSARAPGRRQPRRSRSPRCPPAGHGAGSHAAPGPRRRPGRSPPQPNHRALPGSTESRSRSRSPTRSSTYSSTAARRPCWSPGAMSRARERPAAAAIDRVEVAAKPCSANSSEAASRSRAPGRITLRHHPHGRMRSRPGLGRAGHGVSGEAWHGPARRRPVQPDRRQSAPSDRRRRTLRDARADERSGQPARLSAASLHLGCVQKGTAHSLPAALG